MLLAPHVASETWRARRAMLERAVRNLHDALAGPRPETLDLIPPLRAALDDRGLDRLAARLAEAARRR